MIGASASKRVSVCFCLIIGRKLKLNVPQNKPNMYPKTQNGTNLKAKMDFLMW
jgi:hypothetical protein